VRSQKVKPKLYAHDTPNLTSPTICDEYPLLKLYFPFSFYFETNLNLGTSFEME